MHNYIVILLLMYLMSFHGISMLDIISIATVYYLFTPFPYYHLLHVCKYGMMPYLLPECRKLITNSPLSHDFIGWVILHIDSIIQVSYCTCLLVKP